jgi:large subunit ribosomal protein L10
MENPRPEKVAVVDEVRTRLADADAAIITEYRGIDVAGMSELRRSLRDAGADYKIYKNTLVRFAARDLGLDLDELLTGPNGIAFVTRTGDAPADPVVVAKALRDFAKSNPALVVKGGVLGDRPLSADEAAALADVAPREELLARLAGGLAAPLVQFAGLLQALPRDFAYALSALIEQGGSPTAGGAPADAAPGADEAPEPADRTEAPSDSADPEPVADHSAETPADSPEES